MKETKKETHLDGWDVMGGSAMDHCRRGRGLLFQWFPLSPLPPLPSPFRTGRSGPAGFARRRRPSRMLPTKRTAQTAVSVVVTSLMPTTTAQRAQQQQHKSVSFSIVHNFRSTRWARSIISSEMEYSLRDSVKNLAGQQTRIVSFPLFCVIRFRIGLGHISWHGMISQVDFLHKGISAGWLIFQYGDVPTRLFWYWKKKERTLSPDFCSCPKFWRTRQTTAGTDRLKKNKKQTVNNSNGTPTTN